MTDTDDEIRALVARLDTLMARARPIVEELTRRAREMSPGGGQDGAETREGSDDT